MKHPWILSLFFLATSQVSARSVEVCPALPPESGLEWTYSEGPDFDVCRASALGSEDLAFGIYLGNHPSFHPERTSRIGKGTVAGRRVAWYRQDPGDSGSAFSRQTLLTLDRKWGYVAHIWVAADTEQELHDRLSVLERIVFKVP
ncbi:hypothetical protein LJB71_11420 [Thermomonas sp. S9]|uniref:hypothetical protein n=1 Tax=Thermomonas sp. S9 TaxID=2885203 RepID=UPI00216B6585|nr:hypothetical protein [Thermomonas sp. S9]MCR6496757.1 hypothetical protein [Thermomonas sp. S9]